MKKNKNQRVFIKIVAICIRDFTLREEHLELLPKEARIKVLEFKYEVDRIRAFASELLKHYYLIFAIQARKEQVIIKKDQNKRPYLSGSLNNYDFNISHSQDYVVMVITKNIRAGIDIEYINPKINHDEIGEIVFSKREQSYARQSIESFYILWTKKESLFKAIGTGFMDEKILKKTYLDLRKYQKESYTGGLIFCTNIIQDYFMSVALLL